MPGFRFTSGLRPSFDAALLVCLATVRGLADLPGRQILALPRRERVSLPHAERETTHSPWPQKVWRQAKRSLRERAQSRMAMRKTNRDPSPLCFPTFTERPGTVPPFARNQPLAVVCSSRCDGWSMREERGAGISFELVFGLCGRSLDSDTRSVMSPNYRVWHGGRMSAMPSNIETSFSRRIRQRWWDWYPITERAG